MKIAFNTAPMDARALTYSLKKMHWLTIKEIKGVGLAKGEKVQGILKMLQTNYSDAAFFLTPGDQGRQYGSEESTVDMPAYYVKNVVDTTGAGDVLPVIFSLQSRKKMPQRYASAASALSIQSPETASSIPASYEVYNAYFSG